MRNKAKGNGKQSGFTLIEMLVVIAIIGIMMGLLFPAISVVRENARRANCASNMSQFGKACIGFNASRKFYPPGYLGPTPPNAAAAPYNNAQYLSVHVLLLPLMGMDTISDQIQSAGIKADVNLVHGNWWDADATRRIAENKISVFTCPSAAPMPPTHGAIVNLNTFLGASGPQLEGTVRLTGTAFGERMGITNYLGVQGAWGRTGHATWDNWVGVLYNRSKVADIPDGGSNTLLFGEAVNLRGRNTYAWMGAGALPVRPRQDLINGTITDEKSWQLFSSEHPGIVNFCFADGSVQPLAMILDQQLYEGLAGIRDGLAVDLDLFLNQ